jgi:AcrR family transcriptional regulator
MGGRTSFSISKKVVSPTVTPPEPEAASRRDLAVSRSLDPARARAETRVQRFLDAALELMSTPERRDFTVQQVVERSGQSLRSFYQYFAGKHELLLALFEESVRTTTSHLAHTIEGIDDPLERLQALLAEYYRVCTPGPRGKASRKGTPNPAAIAAFAQQLLTDHPREAAQAFAPLVDLLDRVLSEAAAAGAIRPGLEHRRLAGVLLNEIMFDTFASAISGMSVRGDGAPELWDLVLHGIAAP